MMLPLVKIHLCLEAGSKPEPMSCFLSEVAVTDALRLLSWFAGDVLALAWLRRVSCSGLDD